MMNPTMIYNINAMIEDVLASDMMLEMFNRSSMVTKNENDFVFSAQVMKSNTWPIRSSDRTQIELSGELKAALVKYESIHRLSYDHRKLIWNYQQSKCEMAINYLDKPYMLSMNTYQMAIILLFEKNDHLGFMDIKETLSIPEHTLIDQLACLVESKLLIADPKVFSANCQLSLNFKYRNANTKVKIPSRPEHCEAFLEKTEDIEIVLRHRRFIIQAAIVRFAKRNSPVSHDHLLSGVRQILEDKFELEIPMFERATADLIDGKYLVEDLNNKKLYRYHVP
ncbi:cullin-1-like [Cloeon dipterum]|uniref:cullin-1-like n=1 Tax=Cloeon dipterum TaxID=197152 RepID=UPI00321FA812